MENLNLQPNEGVVLQSNNISCVIDKKTCYGTLVLTNCNIHFHYKRGVFKSVTEDMTIPLNQIKIVNGRVQAILCKNNSVSQLQLYLKTGQISFSFPITFGTKKEINKWIDNLKMILTGNDAHINGKNITASQGTGQTAGVFKNAFGIKSQNNAGGNVTAKCIGCMAPISGIKGQTVQCKYCDTNQTL